METRMMVHHLGFYPFVMFEVYFKILASSFHQVSLATCFHWQFPPARWLQPNSCGISRVHLAATITWPPNKHCEASWPGIPTVPWNTAKTLAAGLGDVHLQEWLSTFYSIIFGNSMIPFFDQCSICEPNGQPCAPTSEKPPEQLATMVGSDLDLPGQGREGGHCDAFAVHLSNVKNGEVNHDLYHQSTEINSLAQFCLTYVDGMLRKPQVSMSNHPTCAGSWSVRQNRWESREKKRRYSLIVWQGSIQIKKCCFVWFHEISSFFLHLFALFGHDGPANSEDMNLISQIHAMPWPQRSVLGPCGCRSARTYSCRGERREAEKRGPIDCGHFHWLRPPSMIGSGKGFFFHLDL